MAQKSTCAVCGCKKSFFLKEGFKIKKTIIKTKCWRIVQNVKKVTYNLCSKKLIMMTDINIKGISRCADCLAIKLFVDKIKEKNELEVIVSQFLIDFL